MVSVVSFKEDYKNPFDTVSKRDTNSGYWLSENTLTSLRDDEISLHDVLNPNKARKTHNKKAIGISIASATLISAGAILLLLKGGPKSLNKGLEKLRDYYLQKIQNAKLTGENVSSNAEFIYSKLTALLGKLEAANNITTMKDYTFKKIMYIGGKYTKKIHQKITNLFERLGRQTVVNSYDKTAGKFLKTRELNDLLINKLLKSGNLDKKITINGKTHTKKEWLKILSEDIKNVEDTYTFHFGEQRRNARYKKMHDYTSQLEKTFDDSGVLWFLSKDTFKSFVAEQKIVPMKMHIQVPIKSLRKEISCTGQDFYQDAQAKILKLSSLINFGEKNALKQLNTLRNDLKLFAQNGSITKEKLISDIDKFTASFVRHIDPKDNERMSAFQEICDLRSSVIDFKPGKVENILNIYKSLLSEEDYLKISKSYAKSIKSMDKSINLETEEFVNKLRDLKMGSAPTDILTILTGVSTLGYYLAKSDDNKERMGITLKYGIPALTLIATCLYGNAKLFAGSKSMALGIISSWIVNRIGSSVNDILMKYFKNKENINKTSQLSNS